MTGPDFAALLAAAAGVALVELDVALAGQLMLSRPIVIGPILGFLLGSPLRGWGFGVLFELFDAGDAPVGGRIPANATVATGAALLLACGATGLPDAPAFALGLAAGYAHRRVELALRRRRQAACARFEARLERGEEPRWARAIGAPLAQQAAATFALLALAVAARPALAALWERAPYSIDVGARAGFAAAPWIALVALMKAARF